MDLNNAIREVNLITLITETVKVYGGKEKKPKMTKEERAEYEKPFIQRFDDFYGKNKKFVVKTDDDVEIHMDWSNHAKAQYVDRVGTEKANILFGWLGKLASAVKDKPKKEYLVYSKSKRLGAIVEPFANEKRIRMITVLPPYKNRPDNNTELVLAEAFSEFANLGFELLEIE